MACGLSKSLGLLSSSSLEKQGIVTILGGECDSGISSNTLASSLRRTFSADMSSKNWLSRNGFCPMKTIASSEELHGSVSDSQCSSDEEFEGVDEDSRSGFDIWTQIQEEKKKKKKKKKKIDEERPEQSGVWGSILSQKSEPIKMVSPPYVHPIVKRTSSSLSEKSLEICTESLGSETGSDGFSWFPSPEKLEAEEEKETKQQEPQKFTVEAKEEEPENEQETWVANHNGNSTNCKNPSPGGSFPPPIQSLSSQTGKSLHMKTRRNNGRLVLEAVSMPSPNNFCANRKDGRLVLTFSNPDDETDDSDESEDEVSDSEVLWFNEEDRAEEEEEEEEEPLNGHASVYNSAHKPNGLRNVYNSAHKHNGLRNVYNSAHKPNGLVSVHRLVHKPIVIPNRNPRWPGNDESVARKPEGASAAAIPVAQSLPPRPRVAKLARAAQPPSTVDDTVGAACFNTYDYYWRPTNKPINKMAQYEAHDSPKKPINDGWLKGCKEQRRSLLFFEPFCIAT